MTKTLYMMILGCCVIFSCKKKDDTPAIAAPDISASCRISKIGEDASDYKAYTYGPSGEITEIRIKAGGSLKTIEYTYGTERVTITPQGSNEVTLIRLDTVGKAVDKLTAYYNSPDLETIIAFKEITYEYNTDGYLTREDMTYSDKNGNIAFSSSTSYTWTDGNLILQSYLGSPCPGAIPENTTYTYYTNKPNAFALTEQLSDFTGKRSKNLLKSTILGSDTFPVSYVFNTSGSPVKMTSVAIPGSSGQTISWSCP
jgi:hypothetical protein